MKKIGSLFPLFMLLFAVLVVSVTMSHFHGKSLSDSDLGIKVPPLIDSNLLSDQFDLDLNEFEIENSKVKISPKAYSLVRVELHDFDVSPSLVQVVSDFEKGKHFLDFVYLPKRGCIRTYVDSNENPTDVVSLHTTDSLGFEVVTKQIRLTSVDGDPFKLALTCDGCEIINAQILERFNHVAEEKNPNDNGAVLTFEGPFKYGVKVKPTFQRKLGSEDGIEFTLKEIRE